MTDFKIRCLQTAIEHLDNVIECDKSEVCILDELIKCKVIVKVLLEHEEKLQELLQKTRS